MKLGLIGGSGLYALDELADRVRHTVMTPWGAPSAPITRGRLGPIECLFLPRHGDHHHLPPHRVNYRANVAALAELGAEAIVGVAAVGGIAPEAGTGAVVVPRQIIDYTWGREHTYFDGTQRQPTHVDFSAPYAEGLRARLLAAAAAAGVAAIAGGIYGATQGPRLESAAEIDRLARDGCTIVGMTGMPEAGLARERGIDYANLSLVVNPAAGRASGPITMADIEHALAEGMAKVRSILIALARLL
jgi:5'-deoxy-5'-methylthioadenosine phosphorylase